ncbi:hypothetical protein [Flexivirga caeni]|uniref:Uncharacterized protein n=1 Tax=Flexivirga caeni TaxID=2294115 RepID=A0A3M9M9R1_9MICO|nr:hypothetical protein [Flexivirga caeni]RNI22246.1 hypothetical protein EFY87_09750 [Flexivirga caeni]
MRSPQPLLGSVRTSHGDTIGLSGMRREFHAATGTDTRLLAGDDSAPPAVAVILETLPATVPTRSAPHRRPRLGPGSAPPPRRSSDHLDHQRHTHRDDRRATVYWKNGLDNTALANYQRAAAAGQDPADPDVADRLAFGD